MRRILFALPLLATTIVFAQAPAFTLNHTYQLGQPVLPTPNHLLSCPVGMAAEQQATGATQWVVSLEDARNPQHIPPGKMGVHVSLAAYDDHKISTARVEVAYMVPPTGMLLVDGNASTQTRTFDLSAGGEPTKEIESSLLIGPGVSITRVKLLGFSYADGAEWQPGGNFNCSVRVSHILRVSAH
jgi:hypothetical protein